MRQHQRKWYETHDFRELGQAKRLEKEVDAMIETYMDDLDKLRPKQLTFDFDL